ncbi:MAG: PatB family C-S lyase, partial [Oscillospiraceae bacterium]|nr:PatB family C-S lyase [Oscillospiraceae bacterium]
APAPAAPAARGSFNFDEIIDREGTNSVKYSTGTMFNPYLPQEHIPMWIADMDFACPQPVLDAMKARLDRRILGYSQVLDPDYYCAVIDWMKRRHGLTVDFDMIIFSSGVIPAMKVAVERLTKPGDGILINTPAYHPFNDSALQFGRTPVYSPLINTDGYYTFDYADFEKKAKDPKNTMFFLCNPHNPSGRVWREEELRRICDICFENNVFIFCDEIHADLVRRGQRHISLGTLYPDKKSGYMTATAPSKTFNLAGNQLSNILIPDRELANDWRMNMYCGMPNPLSIDACKAAYTLCDDWLEALRGYLDDNFAFVADSLQQHLPAARFCVPEGTYLCWIDLRALGKSDEELKKIVSSAGLYIEYADEFVADGAGFVRMNIACPRSILKSAMRILCTSLGGSWEEGPDAAAPGAPQKLAAGDRLPDFIYETKDARGLHIADALGASEKTALLFLRYYGCSVCRLDLHALAQRYDDFRAAGCAVKVVLQSAPALLRKELSEHPLPFEIICDPQQTLYKRFCIAPAKNKLALAGGIASARKLNAAKAAGLVHGAYEGEELQLPAVFIVNADRVVEYAHYGKNLGDLPSPDALIRLAQGK